MKGKIMKKSAKILIFAIAFIWNVFFYHLCGYWQQSPLRDAFFNFDPIIGVIAIIFISLGETSVILQIYYRSKYRNLQKRVFDHKFWQQCLLLVVYHLGCIYLTNIIVYDFSIFYISILALFFSVGWLKGGRILWTSETESYYLSETCLLYQVTNVNENTEMIEISCTGVGYRDKLVSIPQKMRKYY